MNNPAFLALGSNLHDRNLYLSLARTRIGEWPETLVVGASSIEETPPFGPEGQDPYLNQMLLIETHLDPDQLLDRAQAIEAESGRERRERWGPRTLDIDIVWFADQAISRPDLSVPHPELPNRGFWVREMAELYPLLDRDTAGAELPAWARVQAARRSHIERVAGLIGAWAIAMRKPRGERARWVRAAFLHDALRDADPGELVALSGDAIGIEVLRHGPAAATLAEQHGERDREVLDAVRYHSVGSASWRELGRMLYMADYLEPGRPFSREHRAKLAGRVPQDPDSVLLEVARERLIRALGANANVPIEGIQFWNAIVGQR